MDRTTKRALWIVAGVVVLVALVLHHNISSDEILFFIVVVPSVILHEISHGWVARIFGDDTASRAGRLTLNPLVHIDPVGTLIVPAVMALASVGVFGWAKPVPVNTARLRSPRNQAVLVSLAGPLTNFILALGLPVHVQCEPLRPVGAVTSRPFLQRRQHRPDGLQPAPDPAA